MPRRADCTWVVKLLLVPGGSRNAQSLSHLKEQLCPGRSRESIWGSCFPNNKMFILSCSQSPARAERDRLGAWLMWFRAWALGDVWGLSSLCPVSLWAVWIPEQQIPALGLLWAQSHVCAGQAAPQCWLFQGHFYQTLFSLKRKGQRKNNIMNLTLEE